MSDQNPPIDETIQILSEMNLWRRGLPPYDGETPETHRSQPYSSETFGLAIDSAIEHLNKISDLKLSCHLILEKL